MRISLLQEAGRDSCEESGRGPSIKKRGGRGRGMVLPWEFPMEETFC